jgi:hypothetical protein
MFIDDNDDDEDGDDDGDDDNCFMSLYEALAQVIPSESEQAFSKSKPSFAWSVMRSPTLEATPLLPDFLSGHSTL